MVSRPTPGDGKTVRLTIEGTPEQIHDLAKTLGEAIGRGGQQVHSMRLPPRQRLRAVSGDQPELPSLTAGGGAA